MPNCPGIGARTVVVTLDAVAEPSLFDGSGSAVPDEANAVFVNDPIWGAWTVTVKFVTAPFARVVTVGQLTIPFENTPPEEALVNARFVGRMSWTTTFAAVAGSM